MKTYQELIDDLNERAEGLHEYVNSKELNKLGHLVQEIEVGINAAQEAERMLDLVPVSEYDQDRKKYSSVILGVSDATG